MSNLSKRTKKGFTLVELVIVMAVFGLILVAVISIANPVSKIFKKAEFNEKTYSDSNNISLYLQNQLQFADNLVLYTEDVMENAPAADGIADADQIALKFAETYYADVVTKNIGSSEKDINGSKYVNGNVYVLRLANHDSDSETDSEGNRVRKGQIYLYQYPFTSHDTSKPTCSMASKTPCVKIDTANVKKLVPQLSDAYFDSATAKNPAGAKYATSSYATNAKYVYSYALGAHKLTTIENQVSGSHDMYNAIIDDKDNVGDLNYNLNYQNLSVSIIASRPLTAAEESSYAKVGSGEDEKDIDFSVFKGPASISASNIPLLNMSFRKVSDDYYDANSQTSRRVSMVKRYQRIIKTEEVDDPDNPGSKIEITHEIIERQPGYNDSFNGYSVYSTVDAEKDIYFVYAYGDELK